MKLYQPLSVFGLTLSLALTLEASAQSYPPQTVVAQLGDASITLIDVDAMAAQLPGQVRAGVFNNPKRIGETLETMLVRRAMVAPFIAKPPQFLDLEQLRQVTKRKSLISMALQRELENQALPDFTARAQEYYDQHPDEFMQPARVSVRHVLISSEHRGTAAAYQRATELREQLRAGTISFDDAVAGFSDDPSRNQNKGRYPNVGPGMMVPEFEQAAFAMETIGHVTPPVRTQFGYHLIKLEAKHPPSQLPKDQAVRSLSADYFEQHLSSRRREYLASLGDNADQQLLTKAEEMALEQTPEFEVRQRLELEEAVLKRYKQHYLQTRVTGDFEALAREYYLTHKTEFLHPASATVVQVEVPKSEPQAIADIEWLHKMAEGPMGAQFVASVPPPSSTIRQVTYALGDPATARAANIAFALKGPGDRSDIVELARSYFFISLVARFEGMPKSFAEIKKPLVKRFRSQQENKLWGLHVNEYHQLPFSASEEVVASLRTRYATTNNAG